MDPISALAVASLVARLLGGAAETARNVQDLDAFKKNFWGRVKGHVDSGDVMQDQFNVAWIQSALNQIQGDKLEEDGIMGTATVASVIRFQKSRGLNPDGVPGPLTLAAMITALTPSKAELPPLEE